MSPVLLEASCIPEKLPLLPHPLYTTNYILVGHTAPLKLHLLQQDEQWFYHDGTPLYIHIFDPERGYSKIVLGPHTASGQVLQCTVPGNTWFGAEVCKSDFNLSSCSLAPGFIQEDSHQPDENVIKELQHQFPQQASVITRLTGSGAC